MRNPTSLDQIITSTSSSFSSTSPKILKSLHSKKFSSNYVGAQVDSSILSNYTNKVKKTTHTSSKTTTTTIIKTNSNQPGILNVMPATSPGSDYDEDKDSNNNSIVSFLLIWIVGVRLLLFLLSSELLN